MAKVNFTDKWVKSVKADEDNLQKDFWDQTTQGLGLRVSQAGRKSWVLGYRLNNRWRRFTFGKYPAKSLSTARTNARKYFNMIDKGIDPAEKKKTNREADSFAELVHLYIENYAKVNKKSWEKDESMLNRDALPAWGAMKAKDIKRKDVKALLTKIKARGAGVMANRNLAVIRKMFNYAMEEDILESNPCWGVSAPAQETESDRVLKLSEIRKIWNGFNELSLGSASVFKIRLLTAQRGEEVRSMEWSEVDLETGWWTIPSEKAKNGLSHRVPLSKEALDIIYSIKELDQDSPYIFPSPANSEEHLKHLYRALGRVKEASGVDDFVERDFRRTAASLMTGELGVPRLVVGKILNHKEKGITRVYDRHSYDNEKRDALDRWGEFLYNVIGGSVSSRKIINIK